jgi:hypothetical protein
LDTERLSDGDPGLGMSGLDLGSAQPLFDVDVQASAWGAQFRSCSSSVLVNEPTKQVTSTLWGAGILIHHAALRVDLS